MLLSLFVRLSDEKIELSEPVAATSMVSRLVGQLDRPPSDEFEIVLEAPADLGGTDELIVAVAEAACSEAVILPSGPAAPAETSEPKLGSRSSSVREAPPLDVPSAPLPKATGRKSSTSRPTTPLPSVSDRFDPALPEGRRRGPQPIRVRLRKRPVRERQRAVNLIDTELVARAFRYFVVLTFALALLAIDLRIGRTLELESDALAFLRMLAHVGIGAGIVFSLRSRS